MSLGLGHLGSWVLKDPASSRVLGPLGFIQSPGSLFYGMPLINLLNLIKESIQKQLL